MKTDAHQVLRCNHFAVRAQKPSSRDVAREQISLPTRRHPSSTLSFFVRTAGGERPKDSHQNLPGKNVNLLN